MADRSWPPSEVTARRLSEDYPDIGVLRAAIPGLILRHNLYGIDIDGRCTQIASLALWMRAHRAYSDFGFVRAERPRICKTNVVIAEPMPGELGFRAEFIRTLDAPLGRLVDCVFQTMELVGEAGLLLKLEDSIHAAIRENYPESGDLFRIADTEKWKKAEESLLAALHAYAEGAQNGVGYRRRLFAEDAVRGLGPIDLCRTRYDVVLMNPPFGLMPDDLYERLRHDYPEAYYDLAVAFMARGLELLTADGKCGAITTRAFLTVTDAEKFRQHIAIPSLSHLADLGSGVMDGAAVDASAQVLSRDIGDRIWFFDLRATVDKPAALENLATAALEDVRRVVVSRQSFARIPQYRMAYDAVAKLATVFAVTEGIDPVACDARIGASTFEDERFLRARWEVPPTSIGVVWKTVSRTAEEFSLYYYPTKIVTKWNGTGKELCARNEIVNGQTAQARQGSSFYDRQGLVFSRRSSPSIAIRVHPSGASFASNSGVLIPRSGTSPLLLSAVVNSVVARAAVNSLSNRDSYTVGHIRALKWPAMLKEDESRLVNCAATIMVGKVSAFEVDEGDPWFTGALFRIGISPEIAFESYLCETQRAVANMQAAAAEIDAIVAAAYGVQDYDTLGAAFKVASNDVVSPARLFSLPFEEWLRRAYVFAIGVAFGRWNIDSSRTSGGAEKALSVFSELPIQPVLSSNNNAPAILVDDPGQPADIETAVLSVSESMWPDIDRSSALPLPKGYSHLRGWLREDAFGSCIAFQSTGKRSAPLYWQLGVGSGEFSVWIYYHRLTKDTLYTVLNDYVTPRLRHEERQLTSKAQAAGPAPTAVQRKEIAAQQIQVEELRAFRDEMVRVAPMWNPNLNDGVIVNFAPLWRLVQQHRAWQRQCKDCWDSLAEGQFDWAHLSMHLWPERVIPKCAEDRSLAIAHGLEDVFWFEDSNGKWQPRKVDRPTIDSLIKERTSPAVKDALQSLMGAANSTTKGTGRRSGRRSAD